ncbi:MAG: hypothetical protein PHR40_08530 [Bacteroidales bacterium]|nr:hypothetical protein [Bacteroidales bacterium]
MEEKKLTQQESLELISKMIKETHTNIEKGGGNIFLLWGYLWLVVALVVYTAILQTGDYRAQWLWFAMPIIGYPSMYFMLKRQEKMAVTFVSKTISKIWIVMGTCALLLSLFILINPAAFPILFVMALIINAGVALSGLVLEYKIISVVGFIGILLSFALLMIPGINKILVFAIFPIIMLIIPGHILNSARNV